MNYYDELISNIESLLNNKEYEEAKKIIANELNLPYIPRDIEDKLINYMSIIKESTFALKTLTDEEIIEYLSSNPEKQLLGVDALCKKNLRDYIDICDDYLKGDGYSNAKALLIDSLIKQEINYEFKYINDSLLLKFNPSKLEIVEKTEEFKKGVSILQDYFLKEPSKFEMGIELLYKTAMLTLPKTINGELEANNVIKFIEDAFSAK